MITYSFSIQGKGHIQRGIVCQDSSIVDRIKSGYYVGIVADGVGSARHADIGSDIAVKSLFQYCNEHLQKSASLDLIEDILADGYAFAFRQIEREAVRQGAAIEDFDTTLSAVVYNRQTVVYGHSGDGGIIAKFVDGKIRPLSSRQKGVDGTSVIPLRGGRGSWAFGTEANVTSVLLVTDGILDGVIQPSLINLPSNRMALARGNFRRDRVYVTAAEFFMNPHSVYQNKRVKNPDEYMRYFLEGKLDGSDQKAFLQCILTAYEKLLGKENTVRIKERIEKYFYAVWAVSKVTDDKSVVCIMDEKAAVESQDIGYYEEPEWEMLQKKYEAFLYKTEKTEETKLEAGTGKERSSEQKFGRADEETPMSDTGKEKRQKREKDEAIREKADLEKRRMNQIKEKLPAVLISLVIGCFLGSAITLFLTLNFGKTSNRPDTPVTGQPAVGQKNTKVPKTKEPKTEASKTQLPKAGTPTPQEPKTEISENVTDFREDVDKLLRCLLQLNISNLSESNKEKLWNAITQYGFSKYMEILRDKKNNDYNDYAGLDAADVKAVDGLVDDLVQIIKKIKKETLQKGKTEDYKSELRKFYDSYDPEDKRQISLTVREIYLDNMDSGRYKNITER